MSKGNSASYCSRELRRKLCMNSDDAESEFFASNPHGFKISDWPDERRESLKPWERGIVIAIYEVRLLLT